MSWEKYAILEPVVHRFEKMPDLYWKIRPPTTKDEIQLSRFLMGGSYIMSGSEKVNVPHTAAEVAVFEISLLFAGTNIPLSDTDPAPVLNVGASPEDVQGYLGTIPSAVLVEIWQALGKAVPGWGPKKSAEEVNKEEADAAKN
jgi:hypothetical protein